MDLRMTYLWRVSEDYPQSMIGEYKRDGTPDRFLFKKGERILEPIGVPIIKFDCSLAKLREFGCLANNAMVPLISAVCAAALIEMAPDDVQLIKAIVVGIDGETEEFFLLNVTSKVSCIDHEQSEFTLVPGSKQIMSFRRLSLLPGCLGQHGLARDSEYSSHLLVSDVIVTRLSCAGLKGIAFISPSEIAW